MGGQLLLVGHRRPVSSMDVPCVIEWLCGFSSPKSPTAAVVPIAPENRKQKSVEVAARVEERTGIKLVDAAGIEPAPACLLARRTGENTEQVCWCRLRGESTKFALLKYPEVVPNRGATRSREPTLSSISQIDVDA